MEGFLSTPVQNRRCARGISGTNVMRDNFNRLVLEVVELEPVSTLIYQNLQISTNRSFTDVTTETYMNKREILDQVLSLAGVIQDQNLISKGDVVAIISENCCQFIILVFVINFLQATVAPINPNFTEVELDEYLSVLKPNVLFCNSKILPKLKKCEEYEKLFILGPKEGPGLNFQSLDDFFLWPKNQFIFPNETYEEQACRLFAILHTNGKNPKPVMITNYNVVYLFGWRTHFNIFVKESYMGVMPFYHYYTLFSILITILYDMKYYFMSKFNTDTFYRAIQTHQIEVLFSPPALSELISRTPESYKQHLRSLAIIHSAPLPISPDIEYKIRATFNIQIFHSYSLTESTFVITRSPQIRHNNSIGVLHTGIKHKIIDKDGNLIENKSSPGEICIHGMMVSPGYYRSTYLTKRVKRDGYFSTGDIGYLENGYLYITGRAEEKEYLDVTNLELQDIIKKHELVKDVIIVEESESNTIAYVCLNSYVLSTESTKNNIFKHTMDYLLKENKKEIQFRIEILDIFPKNILDKRPRESLEKNTLTKKD